MGKVQGFSSRYRASLPEQDTTLGLHSDFIPGLLNLEHLHINVRLAFNYAVDSPMWSFSYPGAPQQQIPISERIRDSYRRFMPSIISALSGARSLRVFSFKVLHSFDPLHRPSRSHIVQLLFYPEMQEQLKHIPPHVLIVVAVDVAEQPDPSVPLATEAWTDLISNSLPGLNGRLRISICLRLCLRIIPENHEEIPPLERRTGAEIAQVADEWLEYSQPVPEPPQEWEEMMLSEPGAIAEAVHAANCKLWLEYARTTSRPPSQRKTQDGRAPVALINANTYDFRP